MKNNLKKQSYYNNEIETKDIKDLKDDIKNWIVDNWQTTAEDEMLQISRKYYEKNGIEDIVDVEIMMEEVSENIKQGVINVIETYEKLS